MLAEGCSGLGKRRATCRARQQLNAQLGLQPREPAADNRFGHAQPDRSRRNTARISDLYKGLQLFDIQIGVPQSATQQRTGCYYCDESRNSTILLPDNSANGRGPE
ncbi:hypothetical protein RS1P1_05390 [Pseudomonas moraviensis]|nr:hypothetical protein RS1P1_05390 [Pseudomonas moraviensis]